MQNRNLLALCTLTFLASGCRRATDDEYEQGKLLRNTLENDTRQLPHKFGDNDDERLWSFGPLSLQLWNSLRMADYLAARDDVDPQRLAITGASGGGTQTYLLAAVDDRIQVSIPAVMVSAHFQGDDPCEMAPGLRVGTNNMELAAAFAPRPMLLLSSTRDWTS